MSSRWPDKIVIGLTGNIATGKSVVRRMLEHLGAFGIDADGLSHRAMSPGAPAYKPVVDMFGKWIVDKDGQIDRKRLGNVVFSDPDALSALEKITHPLIGQVIDLLIKRANQKVVVIEAIKLFEGDIGKDCDSVWVVDASQAVQLARLLQHRKLTEEAAKMRLAAQPPQREKLDKADIVIANEGGYEVTFEKVQEEYDKLIEKLTPKEEAKKEEPKAEAAKEEGKKPDSEKETVQHQAVSKELADTDKKVDEALKDTAVEGTAAVTIQRGGPKQAEVIAEFLNKHEGSSLSRTDIMVRFGQKAYMLANRGDKLVGVGGYLIENLIARTDEFVLDPDAPVREVVDSLLDEIEGAANMLQAEISLVFLPNKTDDEIRKAVQAKGYEKQTIQDLRIPDWREAAEESQPDESYLVVKKLREDRVLKPL